jgi:hypothetical protein
MAKKALFHEVTIKNGHATKTVIYPAQRGADLKNSLETSNVKVLKVKSAGWHTVNIISSLGELYFKVDTLKGQEIRDINTGFNYLENQFSPIINKINKDIENT